MRAVVLDGSAAADGTCEKAHELLRDELYRRGWEVDTLVLRDTAIAPCRGCFECWTKTPGICVINDAGRDVARESIQSDLVVYLTPVTFGGYSSELKKAVDRLNCLLLPMFTKVNGEVHHKRRYDRYPALLAVGVLAQEDSESQAIFETLVARNAINWHSPVHAVRVVRDGQDVDTLHQQIQQGIDQAGVRQ